MGFNIERALLLVGYCVPLLHCGDAVVALDQRAWQCLHCDDCSVFGKRWKLEDLEDVRSPRVEIGDVRNRELMRCGHRALDDTLLKIGTLLARSVKTGVQWALTFMSLQLDVPTKQKENNDGKKGDDNDNANDDSRDNNVGKPGSWQGWNYGDALRWPTLWRTFFGRQQGLNGRIAISPVCQHQKKWVRKLGWQGGQCRPQQICFLTTHYYCVHLPQVLERNTIDHCVMPLAPLCIATQSFATFQAVLENMTLVTSISGVSVIP